MRKIPRLLFVPTPEADPRVESEQWAVEEVQITNTTPRTFAYLAKKPQTESMQLLLWHRHSLSFRLPLILISSPSVFVCPRFFWFLSFQKSEFKSRREILACHGPLMATCAASPARGKYMQIVLYVQYSTEYSTSKPSSPPVPRSWTPATQRCHTDANLPDRCVAAAPTVLDLASYSPGGTTPGMRAHRLAAMENLGWKIHTCHPIFVLPQG